MLAIRELTATLASLTTTDASSFARAGFVRALELNIPVDAAVKTMLAVRPADPDLARLLNNPVTVKRLVSASSTFRSRTASPSAAARARVAAARQVVARVLAPADLYSYSERAVLAFLGIHLITSSPNPRTLQIGYATVGTELGISERQVGVIMRGLADRRVLRQVRATGGMAVVWSVQKLHEPSEREGLDTLFDAIGALAEQDSSNPVAAAILDVTSPVWGYVDGRTHKHWLSSVVDAAGREMPGSAFTRQQTARELREPVTQEALSAARQAKSEAVERREERAATRIAEVDSKRAEWTTWSERLDALEETVGPAKKVRTLEDRRAWVSQVLARVPAAQHAEITRPLMTRLRLARWSAEARWIVAFELENVNAEEAYGDDARREWLLALHDADLADLSSAALVPVVTDWLVESGWPESIGAGVGKVLARD